MDKQNWKNYSLSGQVEAGVALTEDSFEDQVEKSWFSAKIDRKEFKKLIKRSDDVALRDFALWFALLFVSGLGGYLTWGTIWAVPFFAVYGILYSAADHRHHELSHGTPFKTIWLNNVMFHICAFMTLREGCYYRWSHTRHHSHTLLVGKDPEIAAQRPPRLLAAFSDIFFIADGWTQFKRIARNATGKLTADGQHFVPESEVYKVARASRIYLAIVALVIVAALATQSWLPLMYVVLPRFYGGLLSQIFNYSQHAGLAEDVYDHRLNCRTVVMNPVFSFLYANMNYHIEHHMFPMVPYYNLPKLHEMIKDQCPPAINGMWEAYQEIIPAVFWQNRDPSWFIDRYEPKGVYPASA